MQLCVGLVKGHATEKMEREKKAQHMVAFEPATSR